MSFPVCKFFRSEQGCKFGNKCRFRHSEPSPFPALNQSDHRQSHHDGPVRRFYSAEASTFPQQHKTYGEYEATVRNPRYTENLSDHYYSRNRESECYDNQVSLLETPCAAVADLREKFQNLEAVCQDEGAVGSGSHPALQQRPQRKLCHYFARNGFCCFGSRCRFEHARPYQPPPRFQQGKDGPRSDKDQSSVDPRGKAEDGDGVRHWRCPNEDISQRSAIPCKTGSSAAAFGSVKEKAPRQTRTNQSAESDPALGMPESGNEGRNQNLKTDKICQFFVRGRCWKGRRCRFLHPRRQAEPAQDVVPEAQCAAPEENCETSHSEEQAEGSPFMQNSGTENQLTEPPPTPEHTEPPSTPKLDVPKSRTNYAVQGTRKYRREEVDDVEGSRLRRAEIEQLVKRFPKSKVKVGRDCAEYFQCVVSFSPTDPDWPFDVKIFQLQVDIPSDYPFEMMTVTLPVEQDLPETVRRYLEVSIEEWLGEKERQLADSGQVELVFRPFLRWLDRNIEEVVTEGLKQLKRELVARAAGLEFISAKELQKQYPAQSSHHGDDEDSSDGDTEDDGDEYESDSESQGEDTSSGNDESEEDEVCKERAEEDQSSEKKGGRQQQDKLKAMMVDPERRGTEITLKNLQLKESAATAYFEKICLMIQCERCKATLEFLASPGRVTMVQCAQCCQTQTAFYRPAMAHHFSAVIGYLDLDACLPYDLILQNSSAVIACMQCSKDTRSGAVVSGQPQDQWCRVCHHKLRVATDGVRFTQLQPSRTPQSLKGSVKVVVPSRKRIPKDPAIQEGKPLPNFGTCRHYKKSYRWLRFPCCGKCYPCDVCHDSKEDHEMTFANRMICGFCCREQPFAAERPCKGCDMNMTRVHTKHWEGGQGCRDKLSMSRNDKKKYSNSSKTVSKHAQKVKDKQSKKRTKLRHS